MFVDQLLLVNVFSQLDDLTYAKKQPKNSQTELTKSHDREKRSFSQL